MVKQIRIRIVLTILIINLVGCSTLKNVVCREGCPDNQHHPTISIKFSKLNIENLELEMNLENNNNSPILNALTESFKWFIGAGVLKDLIDKNNLTSNSTSSPF